MIDIVIGKYQQNFKGKMEAMFAERKLVFVDLLKWSLPVTDGRYEIDQFDDADAVYFIATLNDGTHLGSLRLLRTDRPHILGTLFPHLVEGPVPAGPDTREVTRLCLAPRLRAVERRLVRNQLISAMTDYALANGIRTLTGVARTGWLAQIQAMGWRCETLGAPKTVDGTMTGAFRIAIEPSTPDNLGRTGVYVPATNRFFVPYDGAQPAPPSGDAVRWSMRLLADGYCVIPDLVPPETVQTLNADLDARFAATPFCDGGFYGPRTKRFGSLLKRSATAAVLVQHPLILGLAQAVLGPWCDRFNLNLTHPGLAVGGHLRFCSRVRPEQGAAGLAADHHAGRIFDRDRQSAGDRHGRLCWAGRQGRFPYLAAAEGRRAVDAAWDRDAGDVRKLAEQPRAGDPSIDTGKHQRGGAKAGRKDDEYTANDYHPSWLAVAGHRS